MNLGFLGLGTIGSQVLVPFLVGAGVVIALGVVAWTVRASYRAAVKRSIRSLVQAKEAVKALVGGLVETRARLLAPGAADRRLLFAEEPTSPERLGFSDLNTQARIIVDELDAMAIPKSLVPIAEALADIAFLVERHVDSIHGTKGNDALKHLEEVDVERLDEALVTVEDRIEQLAVLYGITEIAVYKGGLYI